MDRFSDWKYLNETQILNLDEETDEVKLKELLRSYIHIPFTDPKQREFALNFHFFNFSFCKEEAFYARKISTFMSIMNDIFINDMRSSDAANTMSNSFSVFQDLILRHSVERPPQRYYLYYQYSARRGNNC
jgi:hypothetical protein